MNENEINTQVQDVRLVSADPNPNRLADGEVPIFGNDNEL